MKLFNFSKNEYDLIPLRDIVVFPNMVIPFFVGRKKSIRSIEAAMSGDKYVFLSTQKNLETEEPGEQDIYSIGTVARILQMLKLPDGTVRLLVEGLERANILKYTDSSNHLKVQIKRIKEEDEESPQLNALIRAVKKEFTRYCSVYRKISPDTQSSIEKNEHPNKLIDTICANTPIKIEKKIELLKTVNTRERLEAMAVILSGEREVLELEQKINTKIKKRLEKNQKNFFLNEQLKEIQKELGTDEGDLSGIKEFSEKIKQMKLAGDTAKKLEKDIKRLGKLQPISPEAGLLRTYLEWITDLPWNNHTNDNKDINRAREILDKDHFDLKKVKERILDFIAVRQLKEKTKGPILCFVGPPGTGKTSLGKSVARALDRKFVRISLGGVKDEAEIRGHRKTYIGALPGKILQAIRKAGSLNPVFLLDEIDKMSSDYKGDPSAALLEVLDPEQNSTFADHYLEVPFDLSNVMFITTANSMHNIPYPLLDRMELIPISGYTEYEKEKIACSFLIPKQIKENGLEWADIKFQKTAVLKIIRNFTMESGVRNLERELANVLRKIAREAVKQGHAEKTNREQFKVTVTAKSLKKYLGNEKYEENESLKESRPGLANGLAWTEQGGTLLQIETAILPGKGTLLLTGNLGDVMKESAQAALSFIRSHANFFNLAPDFYQDKDIHIHVPEGAIPKDGPSAGITMTTALLSAFTGIPHKEHLAMTGEITLTGRLLPIGGVKEKVLAAHRNGMRHVLLPEKNKKDIEDLPGEVLSKITFLFKSSVLEALFALFPEKIKQPTA